MSHGLFADGGVVQRVLRSARRLSGVGRLVDAKPVWAQLNITERCNLQCGYCVEHAEGGDDAPHEAVRSWIERCRALGVVHVEIIGGEPLLHPHLFDILRHAHDLGMDTGLTTNGLLLDDQALDRLVEVGLSRLQISVDRVEPNHVTSKALSRVMPTILKASGLPLWFRVNTVVVPSTIDQVRAVAETLFAARVPVALSLGHNRGRLEVADRAATQELLDWLLLKKAQGCRVDMPLVLFRYYRDHLAGAPLRWSCEGGCKAFYVSPQGTFQSCFHRNGGIPFMQVGPEHLKANHLRSKGCERGCGVACMVVTSIPYSRPDYWVTSLRFGPPASLRANGDGVACRRLSP